MKIGFVGMSGVGKTHWATQFASAGFLCQHCDDSIASRLQNNTDLPMKNIYDLGAWMGFPYEEGFAAKEQQYLTMEGQILSEMAEAIYDLPFDRNVVIDTTGSAIYLDETILRKLKKSVLLVYLALTPEVHNQMLQEYMKRPRPLIWNNLFHKLPGETNESALQRSYPVLITHREKLYDAYSDIRIAYGVHRQSNLSARDFMEIIESAVQQKVTRTDGTVVRGESVRGS